MTRFDSDDDTTLSSFVHPAEGRRTRSRGFQSAGPHFARATPTPNLKEIFQRLHRAFGPQDWWPAETKFEVIVGAILTQNTNWGNVERALANLKKQRLLSPDKLRQVPLPRLAALIRPAGTFNVKARRLKNFLRFFFQEYQGSLSRMASEDGSHLRAKLLSINGIGPETADSILLYALDKPIFVVDAYTKRVLYRHNVVTGNAKYSAVQQIFMDSLPRKAKLFNEYHALIVRLGKEYCRANPRCEQCPLKDWHYSLRFKCRRCHRALWQRQERRKMTGGFVCRVCGK